MDNEMIKLIETATQFATGYFTLLKVFGLVLIFAVFGLLIGNPGEAQSEKSVEQIVAALDTEYQAAVERNDPETMNKILADDFVLVLGDGRVATKSDLIEAARTKKIIYDKQVEVDNSQKVRVWGDTAVVTAKLWVKGTKDGQAFDRKLWFSDTYVKTTNGWKYAFGQASLALPDEAKK